MHYHCEVILPAGTGDIEAAVESVMKPFYENAEPSEDYDPGHAFWDFYVIGGRFAGNKQLAGYDKSTLDLFYQRLKDEKIMVAGLRCGKQEISPKSQIEKVDAIWNEMFPQPGAVMVACPVFAHSNDQYGKDGRGTIDGDICSLADAKAVECSRVIFSGPSYQSQDQDCKWTGPLEATFMLCNAQWNGVNHMPVTWDGTVGGALKDWQDKLENCNDAYRALVTPTDEWITVTVDYHT